MTELIELDGRLRQLADDLNCALIEQLVAIGKLTTPAWRAAFEAVPRHLFTPRFTLPMNIGGHTLDGTDPAQREDWLRAVYHNEALLTDFDEHDIATTSCSAPTVVATMLESSQASEGDTVLEIGTGTGWTAGLLAHRLGSDAVTSVDINARCVAEARQRLDHLGLTPTLLPPRTDTSATRHARPTTGSSPPPHCGKCRQRGSTKHGQAAPSSPTYAVTSPATWRCSP